METEGVVEEKRWSIVEGGGERMERGEGEKGDRRGDEKDTGG